MRVPPLLRQLREDPTGRGAAAKSKRSSALGPRTRDADTMAKSICPYCAVGCGQRVYAKDGKVTQIEGDPDSPVSRGRLCPKGAASEQLVNSELRSHKVKYRPPHGTEWRELDLDEAMEMIADRALDPRQRGELPDQEAVHRDGRGADREPGAHMTLLHRPQSGDVVR
jgi:formate dehydrogenase major subunit